MKKSTHSLKLTTLLRSIRLYYPYLSTAVFFLLYIVIVPQIVSLMIPCLRPLPGESYRYDDCRVITALDRYLVFALGGFAFTILALFFATRTKRLKPLVSVAIILTLLIIILFHLYIPQVEAQIHRVPIFLDTLQK